MCREFCHYLIKVETEFRLFSLFLFLMCTFFHFIYRPCRAKIFVLIRYYSILTEAHQITSKPQNRCEKVETTELYKIN